MLIVMMIIKVNDRWCVREIWRLDVQGEHLGWAMSMSMWVMDRLVSKGLMGHRWVVWLMILVIR